MATPAATTVPELKTPIQKDIIGVLTGIDTLETATGSTLVLLSIQDSEDNVHTVTSSENYWKKVGRSYQLDKPVKMTVEVRIKDVTGYDSNGTMKAHGSSGMNLDRIAPMSQASWDRVFRNMERQEESTMIQSADPAVALALATYYANKR